MIEQLTGTSTIIDAMAVAAPDVTGLAYNVAYDRIDGSLTGDVTTGYLGKIIAFDQTEPAQQDGLGISVSIPTLEAAVQYLQCEDQPVSPSYSTSA